MSVTKKHWRLALFTLAALAASFNAVVFADVSKRDDAIQGQTGKLQAMADPVGAMNSMANPGEAMPVGFSGAFPKADPLEWWEAIEAGHGETVLDAMNAYAQYWRGPSKFKLPMEVLPVFEAGLKKSLEQGDLEAVMDFSRDLGLLYTAMGDFAEAERHFERSLELSQRLAALEAQSQVLFDMGYFHTRQRNLKEAEAVYRQALALSKSFPDGIMSEQISRELAELKTLSPKASLSPMDDRIHATP